MRRHFAGAYIVEAIELTIGSPLAYSGLRYFPNLSRQPRTHLDDYLAFAAMIITGTVMVVAAVVTLLHSRLSYGVIRGARIAAALSDVWMLLTGMAIWTIARQRGGDWAGFGVLGALLFLAFGTFFLVLSLIMLRYIRRMKPGANPSV